jgi:hypothetical protein
MEQIHKKNPELNRIGRLFLANIQQMYRNFVTHGQSVRRKAMRGG